MPARTPAVPDYAPGSSGSRHGGDGPGMGNEGLESSQPNSHRPACIACRESRVYCDKAFPCERWVQKAGDPIGAVDKVGLLPYTS